MTAEEEGQIPGENVIRDPIPGHENFKRIREVYYESNPDYDARPTVPVLYDKKTNRIVSNESSEILRMLGSEVYLLLIIIPLVPG